MKVKLLEKSDMGGYTHITCSVENHCWGPKGLSCPKDDTLVLTVHTNEYTVYSWSSRCGWQVCDKKSWSPSGRPRNVSHHPRCDSFLVGVLEELRIPTMTETKICTRSCCV